MKLQHADAGIHVNIALNNILCHWKRRTLREILGKQKCTLTTYNIPLHVVHTKDPIVTFIYVGPLCKQSKHCLLTGKAASSLKSFVFLSSAVLLLAAILCYYRKLHSSHWYSLDRSYKISIFFSLLVELNPPVVAGASFFTLRSFLIEVNKNGIQV